MNLTRPALVEAARLSIARGSHSFAAASRLFVPQVRARAWLLYCWCRAADDLTDGQEAGHGAQQLGDPLGVHARLVQLTEAALDGEAQLPLPFLALRQVARETALPRRWIFDHLAGFALDAQGWQPQSNDDLLRYCYHVAGTVGLMMAVIMGIDPDDRDTLDRACDLGLAFQLANIARDIVPDAATGRIYLPRDWLAEAAIAPADLALPAHRGQLALWAARLVEQARGFRASARVGAGRLAPRSRLAVLAADAIYGAIGERVVAQGPRAWDARVAIGTTGKLALLAGAALRAPFTPAFVSRDGLWTAPAAVTGP